MLICMVQERRYAEIKLQTLTNEIYLAEEDRCLLHLQMIQIVGERVSVTFGSSALNNSRDCLVISAQFIVCL